MKMMLCIELDIQADTTSRHEIRRAMKRKVIELAREQPETFLRSIVDDDNFIVRAPEKKPEPRV